MKQSTANAKATRQTDARRQRDLNGIDELLELVSRLRRAVENGSGGRGQRPRVRYADGADEEASATRSAPTTGIWGR